LRASERFADKVVLITGAGRGMGRANALQFAREGARVVVNDIDGAAAKAVADEVRALGVDAFDVQASVGDPDQVRSVFRAVFERFGVLDVLVNNAGIGPTTRPMETITDEDWTRTIAIDLGGTFYCMRAALPHMKERRSGKIVNISSRAGRSMSTFAGAHYSAAKAGIIGLTRHTAYEAAPYNININAIAPGSMDTDLLRRVTTAEQREARAQQIPLRRLGTVDDESNLVLFLASEESSYITGATIDLNGADLLI
jgi:3-oxoacyl-[acyl-carrier protein] reductase